MSKLFIETYQYWMHENYMIKLGELFIYTTYQTTVLVVQFIRCHTSFEIYISVIIENKGPMTSLLRRFLIPHCHIYTIRNYGTMLAHFCGNKLFELSWVICFLAVRSQHWLKKFPGARLIFFIPHHHIHTIQNNGNILLIFVTKINNFLIWVEWSYMGL